MIPRAAKVTAAVSTPGSGRERYKYNTISDVGPEDEEETARRESLLIRHLRNPRSQRRKRNRIIMLSFFSGFLVLVFWALLWVWCFFFSFCSNGVWKVVFWSSLMEFEELSRLGGFGWGCCFRNIFELWNYGISPFCKEFSWASLIDVFSPSTEWSKFLIHKLSAPSTYSGRSYMDEVV